MTAYGHAQIDTGVVQTGFDQSGLFDGNGDDYVQADYVADWDFGSGDFTIDFWVYPTLLTSDRCVISAGGYSNGWAIYVCSTTPPYKGGLACNSGGWAGRIILTDFILTSVWSHIAFMRAGNNLYGYINGYQKGHAAFTGTVNSGSGTLKVGTERTYAFAGNMDEVRISKGIARYGTGNDGDLIFTPPTSPYTS